MIPPEVDIPSLETRLNLVSRRILLHLGEQGQADLPSLRTTLQVSDEMAHLSVGWLARSRVVDLFEDASGKLQVRIRRPFE